MKMWASDPVEREFFREYALTLAERFLSGELVLDDRLPEPEPCERDPSRMVIYPDELADLLVITRGVPTEIYEVAGERGWPEDQCEEAVYEVRAGLAEHQALYEAYVPRHSPLCYPWP